MSVAEAPSERAEPAERGFAREALWAYLELAVLWTFAVAQPLFDLLGDNPEFFAARGSTGFEIVSFSLLLVLAPPLALLAVELLLGVLGRPVRRGAHLVLLAALVALIAAQALKKSLDISDALLVALSVGVGAALAALYARAEPVRSFLRVLSPAPLVFLLLFLVGSPVSKLAFPDEAGARTIGGVARAPIVVVLLDELPSLSLMDERRRVDAERFPGFAELARSATWFRNAYTVYDSTERAQPAIMDGNYPEEDHLPTSSDHPNSIFSLFAKTHRLHVSEEATSVCSRDLCEDERLDEGYSSRIGSMTEDLGLVWLHVVSPPEIESELASVSENWGNFGGGEDEQAADAGDGATEESRQNVLANLNANRAKRFSVWIDEIQTGRRPELSFKHALLPHVPWQYLPSGARYRTTPRDAVPGLSTQAYESPEQRDVLLQRHLLQLGFVDTLLQRLWRKLRAEGIWNDALIVVAADHGVALQVARRDRRRLRRDTVGEIASIPFFLKAPGQRRGTIDDAYVESVDVLPTIFDVLELDPRVRMDGRSAFGDEVQGRTQLRMFERNSFEPLRVSPEEYERQRAAALEHTLAALGTGREGRERIYRVGPNQQLLGRRVAELDVAGAAGARAELVAADDLHAVDPAAGFVPSHVVARVEGGPAGATRDVAIAVNGEVAAVSRSFALAIDRDQELISAMVPPWTLRPGRNEVELFEVSAGGALARLGGS